MKSQEIKYVGIDCGKKTLEVIWIGNNSLHQRQQFSTTEIGISKLINWFNPNDVEDSLKIEKLIQRFPIEELPVVPIPNDEEEDNRRLCTEQENWTRQLMQSKNRLHSLFTQAGLTHITKKHLRTKANREISVALLPSRYQKEAERILKVLDLVEQNLKLIEEEIKEALRKNQAYVQTIMSMPGRLLLWRS
ncbi:hypothetical protein LEP1GSC132_0208 [Leptospira kirschneri str. 200803703]|uniref:Transposase n=1 Tax=Leptospira kirschneri str. 200802841 TaxID=1193047 RepID=A0A828Y2K1_9LEPT|nr:hypothetical protein LEP1GSC131_3152 [Leptospira kirschneri str. 200802841]EMO65681.1 hypothetical protein LEP1GSC132_0208 [Leptospira kirschneri str. 200803703]EMO75953.1 hypothetical protein LEP1GSC127_0608 [Leptospira kirschneri str. 200801925]